MPLVTELTDLPAEFLELLPTECKECSSPLTISNTLTSLQCSNANCFDRVAHRVVAACQRLDILGVGYASAKKFVEEYEVTCPLAMFQLSEFSPDEAPFFTGCNNTLNNEVHNKIRSALLDTWSLGDYVALAFLPNLQTSAGVILEGYSSLEDFYDDLTYEMVKERLGVSSNTYSLRADKIYRTLVENQEDLLENERFITVSRQDLPVIRVCISDSPGLPFRSKRDFMNRTKNKSENYGYTLEFLPSLTKKVDYLVNAGERVTGKVRKAMAYDIPILTGKDFEFKMKEGSL